MEKSTDKKLSELMGTSILFNRNGDFLRALNVLKEVIEILEQDDNSDTELLVIQYLCAGKICIPLKRKDDCLKYAEAAIRTDDQLLEDEEKVLMLRDILVLGAGITEIESMHWIKAKISG